MSIESIGSFRDQKYARLLGDALDAIEEIEANIIDALDGKLVISNEDALDTAIAGLQAATNSLQIQKNLLITEHTKPLEKIDEAI